jgi:SHS2 domain-containing protein
MGGFEIVEHTADVGIRAWGDSAEELFEQAARGLLDISGAWRPGGGKEQPIELESGDLGGLLVDWLNEILYLQETRNAVISDLQVASVAGNGLTASIALAERPEEIEGTAVKAVTYHQLKVVDTGDGWEARVYVDV